MVRYLAYFNPVSSANNIFGINTQGRMVTIQCKTAENVAGDELTRSTLSLVARSMADKYKSKTEGLVCKRHPKIPHVITIVGEQQSIKVEHSKFCCKGFEKNLKKLITPQQKLF